MLKRNIAILIAGGLLSAQVGLAIADQGTFPKGADDQYWKPLPAQAQYLEQRAAKLAQELAGQRTVNITASTKYINAEHDGVLVVKNDKGQSFTWRADTLGEADIPLKAIAPTDFAAGQTRVFVRHPAAHIPG